MADSLDLLVWLAQMCRMPKHEKEYDQAGESSTTARQDHVEMIEGHAADKRFRRIYYEHQNLDDASVRLGEELTLRKRVIRARVIA